MIGLAAVIGASTLAGLAAQQRWRDGAMRLSRRSMDAILWLALPVVIFFNIAALEVTVEVAAGLGFGWAAIAVAAALAYAVGTWGLRLERPQVGAVMIAGALGNTGFLGLPFALALLGAGELPSAVAYDVLVSGMALVTVGFSIGAAFGTVAERPRARVAAFFARNPALWATAAGFLAPAALAPGWAVEATRVLVLATIPVGFFAVGVTLAAEGEGRRLGFPPRFDAPVATATALKLLVAPAVVAGLSALLVDVPDAYLSQAAMASGINTIVVANAYGLDRGIAAGAIAWTTAIVVAVGLVVALV